MSVKKFIISFATTTAIVGSSIGGFAYVAQKEEQQWQRICDGTEITAKCSDEEGTRYNKYVYHEAIEEVTEKVEHPAEPAVTHNVHHNAVYGTEQYITGCVRTTISYKHGTCALSQCRDGSYSGSTGWGTCNYHGGVARTGGPWYTYGTRTVLISPSWDETVVDKPAKEAWTETVVITPAQDAYYEKEIAYNK